MNPQGKNTKKWKSSTFTLSLLLVFSLGLSHTIKAQNPWKTLADVSYKTKLDESGKYPIQYPIFGDKVKVIDKQQITLKGFMVPLENLRGESHFVLSMLPFNICYFCGGAGPETVVEVYTQGEYEFVEEAVEVTGILKINHSDPNHLMYVLENATVREL